MRDRVVYFARQGENVKIGITCMLGTRLYALRSHHGHDLQFLFAIPGGYKTEKWFHQRFADREVAREWFAITGDDIKAAVDEYTQGQDIQLITELPIQGYFSAERAEIMARHTDRPEFPHGEFDNGQHWQGQD